MQFKTCFISTLDFPGMFQNETDSNSDSKFQWESDSKWIWVCFHITTTEGVYPFDPISFNLIDVTSNCYPMGLCPEYGEWGKSIDSIYPSSEERTLHLLRNIARLFPTEYRSSKYGALLWGYKGSAEWQWSEKGHCGQSADAPFYWYSMGNQAARFHQWDKATCFESIGHETCSSPNRCRRFGSNTSCSFSDRSTAFIPLGGIWGRSEGLFGMNNAFDGGHCSAVFDPDHKYIGIGYWPSMSSATYLYIKVCRVITAE